MPHKSECTEVTSQEDIDKAHGQEKIFVQERGMIRRPKNEAEDSIQHIQDKDNTHWEKGDLLACPTNYPEGGEAKTKYHASPSKNEDSIEENGLMPSPAQKSCGKDGVYVTETKEQAEGWAETLGAEQGHSKFTVYKVNVPEDLRIEKDEEPINRRAVPKSKVVCTDKGMTRSQVSKVDETEVDPTDESNYGGFR